MALDAGETRKTFHWEDPLDLASRLSEEERMVAEAAHAYARGKLLPRVVSAWRDERFDREIMSEMGERFVYYRLVASDKDHDRVEELMGERKARGGQARMQAELLSASERPRLPTICGPNHRPSVIAVRNVPYASVATIAAL